jgi:hypothetical protein
MRAQVILFTFLSIAVFCSAAHSQALINPLPLIIQYESGGNPLAQSNSSTASGLAGDINATWATALQACGGPCGTIAQYPTAASAPIANQIAANNALINSQGLQPWLCPGCDNAFSQAVAANGGPSAFQTSGLDTNPADFANFNTDPAAFQTFLTNVGVSTTGQPTTGTGTGTVTANASLSTNPFQYVYSTLIDGITQQISTAIQATNTLVYPYLISAIALACAFMGVRVMFGRGSFDNFLSFVISATIVGTLLAPDSQEFLQWIQQPILELPTTLGTAFGVPDAGPAAIFDDSAHTLNAISNAIAANIPVSLGSIGNTLFVSFLWLVGIVALVVLFAPFLLTTFFLLLMVIIAPVPIIFGLFPLTRGWTKGYADTIATLALTLLAVDVVVSMIEGGLIQVLTGFNVSGSSQVDMAAFGTLAVVLGVMAFALWYMAPSVARIAGGVAVPMPGR